MVSGLKSEATKKAQKEESKAGNGLGQGLPEMWWDLRGDRGQLVQRSSMLKGVLDATCQHLIALGDERSDEPLGTKPPCPP